MSDLMVQAPTAARSEGEYEALVEDLEQRLVDEQARTYELETAVEALSDLSNRDVYAREQIASSLDGMAFSLVRLAEAADRIAVTTDALTIYASTANQLAARSWWRRLLGRGVR